MYKSKGVGGRLTLIFMTGLAAHTVAAGSLFGGKQHYIKKIHHCKHEVAAGNFVDDKPHPWKDEPLAPSYRYVAAISGGPVWATGGDQKTIQIQPVDIKTFTADKPTSTVGEVAIFLGLQHFFYPRSEGQLGIEVAAASDARLSGQIWDDENPIFNNHTYSYKVNHTHVAVKGKWLNQVANFNLVTPYLSASLGVAFNRASGFCNTPTIPEAEMINNFTTRTTNSFTYTLGVGIQRTVWNNIQVGVGYEFADWGQSNLAMAPEQIGGGGLSLDHLYTNGLMFNLTYVA